MRAWSVVLVTLLGLTACDFFRELQSLPDAGEDESGSDEGSFDDMGVGETEGSAACTAYDNYCAGQDLLYACDPDTLDLELWSCSTFCGSMNFTCMPNETVPGFPHSCWCAEPGNIKIYTCSELEECIFECGGDPNEPCTQDCFTRTDTATVRLLGALYSCADLACDVVCDEDPGSCAACLVNARAGLWGGCGSERKVCNDDKTDEPSWP